MFTRLPTLTKYYAGIGSRKTPRQVLECMTSIANRFERHGWILRSGGAAGADSAFSDGTSLSEIFLADDPIPMWAEVFVDYFHPAPHKLQEFPRRLMARNALQILGKDGNTPVDCVICWTPDGKASGGTGQAIRIADYYGIKVHNLHDPLVWRRFSVEKRPNG